MQNTCQYGIALQAGFSTLLNADPSILPNTTNTTLSRYKICTWLQNWPFLRKARGQIGAVDISEFLGAFLVFTFGAFDHRL
jgi:hypothetical protein